ncbi:hypothetical protein INT43_000924 [Umbelopsis isabellina]|uniref:BHLH domain-containing protein n=1 Tax=Mortierella isabellina TaxID=91625 RepID=A0A8H7Q5D9_MORIS|nr:hypothetical protein INT43_000924 [Umbelopsis isabellina]
MTDAEHLQLRYPTTYHMNAVKARQSGNSSLVPNSEPIISEAEYINMRQLSYITDMDDLDSTSHFKLQTDNQFSMPPYQFDAQTVHPTSIPIGVKNTIMYPNVLKENAAQGWLISNSPSQMNPRWSSAPNHRNSVDYASPSPSSYEDDPKIQANIQQAMERRRRRRESHNAVERRRRDHINECIQKIGFLLPDETPDGLYNKSNKGSILQSSIEFIKSLEEQITFYQSRITQLEADLCQVGQQGASN